MRTFKTSGVIINRKTIGEKDYKITIFTPEFGKIEASARGARNIKSKFTGYLDILNICEFELYKSPNYHIITECELIKNYNNFRENLSKFYVGSKVSEMILHYTTENEENHEMFKLLIDTLEAISIHDKENIIGEAFKIKLFEQVGIMPNLYSLHETEFENMDLRIKKLLNFLLTKPYEEIIKLYLDQQDHVLLLNMTNSLQFS